MRAIRFGATIVGVFGIFAACGGSSSSGSGGGAAGTLDCAWLAGNNCWRSTLAAASGCLPATTDKGTLSADMKTCTYADGKTITFDDPLVTPLPSGKKWTYTVTSGGTQCLRFEEPAGSYFKLTTSAGTVNEQIIGGGGISIACPDGTSYSTSNGLSLLSCDAGVFGGLPGTEDSDSSGTVSLSLLGGAAGATHVFTCGP